MSWLPVCTKRKYFTLIHLDCAVEMFSRHVSAGNAFSDKISAIFVGVQVVSQGKSVQTLLFLMEQVVQNWHAMH